MNQQAVAHPQNDFKNVTFQQKSNGLTLVIVSSTVAYYFSKMWPMRAIALENNIIPDGFGNLVLSTIGIIIVSQIVLQIVLAIGAGETPKATAHEKMASLKATRNAYSVLAVGIFAAIGTMFLEGLTPFCTANLAILSFALAEIVKYGSMLVYGRR